MLTDKQESFVQELIKGKSQREAYRIAYPKCKALDKTVDEKASKLFSMDKIRARYNEIHDKMIAEAEAECIFDGKRILKEMVSIALADASDYVSIETDPDRSRRLIDPVSGETVYLDHQRVYLKDTVDMTKRQTAAIKSIKQGRYGIEIELYPKDKSLEMLGRHLKLFTESIEVKDTTEHNPVKGLTTDELKKALGLIE